jgi:hypothetical protein
MELSPPAAQLLRLTWVKLRLIKPPFFQEVSCAGTGIVSCAATGDVKAYKHTNIRILFIKQVLGFLLIFSSGIH